MPMNRSSSYSKKKPPAGVFIATTVVMFVLTLSAADSIGFVPDYIDGTAPANSDSVALSDLPVLGETTPAQTPASTPVETKGVAPKRLVIDSINLDLPVQNPQTRDIDALDTLLQKGPARYMDSAQLAQDGNVLIFAHSSHLPIVHNNMFQAFNRIPELKAGDSISLFGVDGKEYLYSVSSVRKADANDTTISLSSQNGKKLTLVTCDTLTSKSARFVLEADYVGVANAQ